MPDENGETFSVIELLGEALQAVVFGNGLLIVVIAAVFAAAVVLSRAFKGGSL